MKEAIWGWWEIGLAAFVSSMKFCLFEVSCVPGGWQDELFLGEAGGGGVERIPPKGGFTEKSGGRKSYNMLMIKTYACLWYVFLTRYIMGPKPKNCTTLN